MIHISKGNIKVKFPNISLIPVKDCGNCEYCKTKCYALKAYRQYPNVRKNWDENSVEFRKDPYGAALKVVDQLKKREPKYFRIHVAGDFLGQDYLDAWFGICYALPRTKFMVNTKMFDLDYSGKPDNMKLRFSMWPGMKDTAPKGFPRAWLDDGTDKRIPSDAHPCHGECHKCLYCWEKDGDVVFKLH